MTWILIRVRCLAANCKVAPGIGMQSSLHRIRLINISKIKNLTSLLFLSKCKTSAFPLTVYILKLYCLKGGEERELILVVSPLSHACQFLEQKSHFQSITVISKPAKHSLLAATESPDKDK